jgi:hypothetical protein
MQRIWNVERVAPRAERHSKRNRYPVEPFARVPDFRLPERRHDRVYPPMRSWMECSSRRKRPGEGVKSRDHAARRFAGAARTDAMLPMLDGFKPV